MKRLGFITIAISTLLCWGWLSAPIIGVASTAESPATIRFDGQAESSNPDTGANQLHVTEASKSSSSVARSSARNWSGCSASEPRVVTTNE